MYSNCQWNANRGSELSKFIDFRIDFSLKFHVFFRTPFPRPFFEGPSTDLCSQIRFLTDLRFSRGPKNKPWSTISAKEAPKGGVPFLALGSLKPTWTQFGAENVPRTHLYRFGIVFWSILEGFWANVRTIIHLFWKWLLIDVKSIFAKMLSDLEWTFEDCSKTFARILTLMFLHF